MVLRGVKTEKNILVRCKHTKVILLKGTDTRDINFFTKENMELTIKCLQSVVLSFLAYPNFVGIELLNEPAQHKLPELQEFYLNAYKSIRQITPDLPIYICDGFNLEYWVDFIDKNQLQLENVILDTHQYFCHTPQDHQKSAATHIANVTQIGKRLAEIHSKVGLIVGEWSAVLNNNSYAGGNKEV